MKDKIYDWRELNLQSGDILLCEGKSKLSKRIQWFQRLTGADDAAAKISHVAGVVKYANMVMPYAMESTTFNEWAGKRGVQLNKFDKWVYYYDGIIKVRKLDFERTQDYRDRDRDFWMDHMHDPYESGIMGGLELLLCGLRLDRAVRWVWPSYEPLVTKEPHCSELIARRLEVHNMLPRSSAPTNRMPPHLWVREIDSWLTIPITEPIRIK